jgi:hypothetical protein
VTDASNSGRGGGAGGLRDGAEADIVIHTLMELATIICSSGDAQRDLGEIVEGQYTPPR